MFAAPFRAISRSLAAAVVLVASVLAGQTASAAGLLTPSYGSRPALELRDHEVRVVVEDGYAITTIEQVFHNPHGSDLEAIYSFPVPEKAAVSEFTYWIDGQPVTGEVLPKAEARQVYDEEKAAGREAALAEQDSYKTFDMTVWPVRAKQDVRVRLAYMQPAHIDKGIGRFVYPLEEGGVDEQKLAFWTANEVVTGRFSFDLALRSAYPVEALRVPAHPQATVSQEPDGTWRVQIDNGAPSAAAPIEEEGQPVGLQPANLGTQTRLDEDIVVYWRLKSGLPGSVDLVAHKPDTQGRGSFMLVVTPGADLKPITEGRDWIFVLDKSGSMGGKWHTLINGVADGLKKLRPEDRFRIVLFDERAYDLTGSFRAAEQAEIHQAVQQLVKVQPGQGTNLYGGLESGLNGLDADRSAAILLVTDGVANVGETRQRAFLDLVRKQDVRLYTFIMGNSANRPLLEVMTRESGGSAVSVSNSDDVAGAVLVAVGRVTHQALHDVSVSIDGVRTGDLSPAKIGSLYRGQQLVLFGHYWGDGPAEVSLSAKISGQPVSYRTRFDFPGQADANPEIERLWAFASIEQSLQELADFGPDADVKQAVVDLAVEYGLVTPFTSMVVLREEIFQQRGIERHNRDRVADEHQAQAKRSQKPVASHRVDQSQPMFQGQQPSHGGGGSSSGGGTGGGTGGAGALGPLEIAFALLLLVGLWQARRRTVSA